MARPAYACVNLDAIIHNYLLSKQLSVGGQSVAIIKGNAYGHGAVRVAQALAPLADAFGVACIEEALELREAGISTPILLLEGFFNTEELPLIEKHQLWTALHSYSQLEMLEARPLNRATSVWLKMDSGMHRLGFSGPDFRNAYSRLSRLPWVGDLVLMSHFSCADELGSTRTDNQLKYFNHYTEGLSGAVSVSNSAATLAHNAARQDWQRPGLMLYGASPFDQAQDYADQLRPAMSLKSEIIAIRELNPGDAVGYGATYVCDSTQRIATVAMGYADGYPRSAKSGTPVIINGKRASLVGRVSMDMLAIDITHLPEAKIGDEAELWGNSLSINEVARWCDTIPYTLMTGITRRVHMSFISD